jgi:hypothetical protein
MPIGNTFLTTATIGMREELSDVIYNISPEETPFISNISKKGKVSNTLYEWQTDELANVDTGNAVAEGDDVTSFDAVVPTVRLQNYCQISDKTVIISDTQEVVNKAGRNSEIAYQIAKKGKELRRDMEAICLARQVAAGGGTRTTGSMLAFIKTNTNKATTGTSGVDPVYTTLPNNNRTDGTQRAFIESMLKDVIQKCWAQGASPKMLMVGPFNKQAVSAFTGIAQQRYQAPSTGQTRIVAAADVYQSDFGELSVVPNRFQRDRDAFVLDPEYAEIVHLRPFKQRPLAKTGDAEKRQLIVEWGLKVHQEKAHGLVADLTTA